MQKTKAGQLIKLYILYRILYIYSKYSSMFAYKCSAKKKGKFLILNKMPSASPSASASKFTSTSASATANIKIKSITYICFLIYATARGPWRPPLPFPFPVVLLPWHCNRTWLFMRLLAGKLQATSWILLALSLSLWQHLGQHKS